MTTYTELLKRADALEAETAELRKEMAWLREHMKDLEKSLIRAGVI